MSAFSDALSVTSSGLKAQANRLRVVSENIANVDTPGYRKKTLTFEPHRIDNGLSQVETGPIKPDRGDLPRIFDPEHPMADGTGHYDGSSVDLMIEIANAREAQRSYEANLKMFQQTRDMSSGLMDLLRK